MTQKLTLQILVIVLVVGAIAYFEAHRPKLPKISIEQSEINLPNRENSEKESKYPHAVEIVNPSGFINTDPLKVKDLIGKKVILVDFWTYSCINCQRTTPYLNAWYSKYKDQGLEILGIHTPEFEFEHKPENVAAAVKKFGVQYPVVMDNDYGTWSAYGNRYWPRKYLIDIDGYIVYDHIGEGAYDETEKVIQNLLKERAVRLGLKDTVTDGIVSPSAPTGSGAVGSPEVYFGFSRNEFLGNGVADQLGIKTFTISSTFQLNKLYLGGDWKFDQEFAENKTASAKIIFRYKAQDVYFVASSKIGSQIQVLKDGKPLTAKEAGEDITVSNGSSTGIIKEERLYKLIHDQAGSGEHVIEIIIKDPGLNAFTFTFG
ncbi:MAG: redoxin family protein [Patescibacteria group bacterium]